MRQLLLVVVLAACSGPQGTQPQQSAQDVDRDGVPDVSDKCAYDPGPDANSGCPEKKSTITVEESGTTPPTTSPPVDAAPAAPADRDGDRIADDKDQCPDQAETYNGTADDDGCQD